MTSPMMRMLADRIVQERHRRRNDGRELESVSVAPMVADAIREEFDGVSRLDESETASISGMRIHGVTVESDDDLSAMEFEQ